MCTVTYLPRLKSGYILTSNRDEKVERPSAFAPALKFTGNQNILLPTDALHFGTWIACSDTGRALCLLNGGIFKHIPLPEYKKSRGLVLIDAFDYLDGSDFVLRYDLTGIEPFTLIFIDQGKLNEIKWDGSNVYLKRLNPLQPYIWSSVTLYSEEIINQRKIWFDEWLSKNPDHEVENILDFHHFAGSGNVENDIQMNRDNFLKTVSITSVSCFSGSHFVMHYEDLKSGQKTISELTLNSNPINESIEV